MLPKISIRSLFFLILFFFLAVFITFPLIFHLTSLTTGYGDEFVISWSHNWDIYYFSKNLPNILHIFDANIFFPYHNSLAFSDVYFTDSILALVPVLLLKSPIVANNFTIILSLTLLGFFTYFLSHTITKNTLVSFLAGVLVIFSPAFLSEIVHIQIIAIYFVPLSIIFLIKFLKNKKTLYFFLFLACLVTQAYNSFMPAYFIVFAAFIICVFFILEKKERIKIIITKKNILLTLASVFLIALVAVPYFKVSKEFNYTRDIRETIHFALQPEDFLSTSSFSRFNNFLSKVPFTRDLYGLGEVKPGFLGLIFTILVIISFFYTAKNWKKQNYIIKGIFAVSLLGLLLSLGPFMHFQRLTIHEPFPIPLPYAVFYYLIPGFMGMRNSARFEFLFIIFSAPLIANFLNERLKITPINKKNILLLGLSIFVILEFNFPIKYYPLPQISDFPKVYSYLSTTPKETAIIEMPIYNWNIAPYASEEFRREYYSTVNFRKTVNGASGFSPPPWQDLVQNLLVTFPSKNSITKLKNMGVNLIIVHKSEYDILYKNKFEYQGVKIPDGISVINFLLNYKGVFLIKQFGSDYVFKIK